MNTKVSFGFEKFTIFSLWWLKVYYEIKVRFF